MILLDARNMDSWPDFAQHIRDFVIKADIDDNVWLPSVCRWGVHIMTISAAYPPWSGAAKCQGLNADQGCLLPSAILRCHQVRPQIVVLGQVNGFSTHQDKSLCIDLLRHDGYQLVWQKIVDAASFGGFTRLRWLAIAIRISIQHM